MTGHRTQDREMKQNEAQETEERNLGNKFI